MIISMDENYDNIRIQRIGTIVPFRGYSSCKFLPNRPNLVLVLRSEEDGLENQETYISLLDISGEGRVLIQDQRIGPHKYEGVEFI